MVGDEWTRVTAAADRPGAVRDRDAVLGTAMTLGMGIVPEMAGCSVTRHHDGVFGTPISANDLAVALDEAQYEADAGPCLTAARGEAQRLDAADREPRYPEFSAAAARHGVGSSLSVPLPGVPEPAALNLYATVPAAFGAHRSRLVADLLARCLAALLEEPAAPGPGPVDLAAALRRRTMMRAAEEELMVREQLSRAGAFHRLAERSVAESRSIFDVARDSLGDTYPDVGR